MSLGCRLMWAGLHLEGNPVKIQGLSNLHVDCAVKDHQLPDSTQRTELENLTFPSLCSWRITEVYVKRPG